MKKIIWKLSLYSSRPVIAAALVLSAVAMAFTLNYIQSQLWWGYISTDLLVIGTIDAIIICAVLVPVFIYFITRITALEEERRANGQILKSERLYRLIAENVNDVVWIYDTGVNKFTYVSPSITRQTGFLPEEVFQMSIGDILLPDSFSLVKEILIQKMVPVFSSSSAENYVLELRQHKKDGSFHWIEVNARLIMNSDTRALEILGISRDINEKKLVADALKESEEKFSRIFHDIPMILLITSVETGKVYDINESVLEFSGYSPEEIMGKTPVEIGWLTKEDKELIYKQLSETGRVNNVELLFRRKDGVQLIGEYFARIITITGKPFMLSVIRDITEKKKIEKELIEAKEKAIRGEKIKTDFLTQMSHEIRTPVSSVLNLTSLMYEELRDKVTEDMTDVLGMITDSGKRIIRTIDMILNMSEILSDSYDYKPAKLSLHKVIHPIASEYKATAKAKGVALDIRSLAPNDTITADEYSLSQIITHLVDNAVKFTDKGKVSVVVSEKNSEAYIVVSDTGCGISEDYLESLFEPFSQETQGYTRKYDGNGLGLALVKKFCDMNNISLGIQSEKGKGTSVSLTFLNKSIYN